MDFIFDLDYKVIDFLQSRGANEALDPFIVFITKIGDSGFIWFLIIGILLLFRKQRKVGVVSFISLGMVSVLGEFLLKNLVQRERPFRVIEGIDLIIDAPSDFSFPSMHSGSSFAVACVLLFYWGWKASPFMALAIAIATSRAYLFVHFTSDVIVGAVLGIMTAAVSIAFDQVVNIDAILDKIYAKFRRKTEVEEDVYEEKEEFQVDEEEIYETDLNFDDNEEFEKFNTEEYSVDFDTAQFDFNTAEFDFDNFDEFEYENSNNLEGNNNVQLSNMTRTNQRKPILRKNNSSSIQSITQQEIATTSSVVTNSINTNSSLSMRTTPQVQRQMGSAIKSESKQNIRKSETQNPVVKQELLNENHMTRRKVKKKVQKPMQQSMLKQKPVVPKLPSRTQKASIQDEEDDFMEFYNKRKEEIGEDFDFDFRI